MPLSKNATANEAARYVRGILRNRLHYVNDARCLVLVERAIEIGVPYEPKIRRAAESCTSWSDFVDHIERATGKGWYDLMYGDTEPAAKSEIQQLTGLLMSLGCPYNVEHADTSEQFDAVVIGGQNGSALYFDDEGRFHGLSAEVAGFLPRAPQKSR